MPNRGFHQTRSCLRLRLLVGERIQDALIRGILFATCRSLRLLGGLDAAEDVERAEILQLLRGQLFTLGVLGDEVNLHTLDLVDAHAEDQALLF